MLWRKFVITFSTTIVKGCGKEVTDTMQIGEVLDSSDPGDKIIQRFFYQFASIAQMAIDLIGENSPIIEIFCEHFEDGICRLQDGKFVAIQIKTREIGLDPYKAGDTEIVSAFSRFSKIEDEFSAQIKRFVFLTNHGFWHDKPNGSNLKNIMNLIQANKYATYDDADKLVKGFIDKINKKSGVSKDVILRCLKKTVLENGPGLKDIQLRVIQRLSVIPQLMTKSHKELQTLAERLIFKVFELSSYSMEDIYRDYMFLFSNPEGMRDKVIINNKRLTKESIERLIEEVCSEDLLQGTKYFQVVSLPKGFTKLQRKMLQGGLPVEEVQLTIDHKTSLEKFLISEMYKSENRADKINNHLRLIVTTECQEAYGEARQQDEKFGQQMLSDVRKRLRERWRIEREFIPNLRYEHFCGYAGVLTEECKVWWSEKFDVEEE